MTSQHIMSIPPTQFGVKSWNVYQRAFFDLVSQYGTNQRYLIGFKPGAGKTLSALGWLSQVIGHGSAFYVAPFRALCSQVHEVVESLDYPFPNSICVLGGSDEDAPVGEMLSGERSSILISTPEVLIGNLPPVCVKRQRVPIIIDEVHIRHDPQRGWLYDLLIRYFKDHPVVMMSGTMGEATVHSISSYPGSPIHSVALPESDRMRAEIIPIRFSGQNPSVDRLARLIGKLVRTNGQVIVFVGSKKYGGELLQAVRVNFPLLSSYLHSADLSYEEREEIEEEFSEGDIHVLIHTTTLVTGVDFDVTSGVIAQVRTGMGPVPLYDVIQAASRVGRRRPGEVRVLIPKSWDVSDYETRVRKLDCGYPPTPIGVSDWIGCLWSAWAQYLDIKIPSTELYDEAIARTQDILGPSYISSLRSGVSPLTTLQLRTGLSQAEKRLDNLGEWTKLSPEAVSSIFADALYLISEVRGLVPYPAEKVLRVLTPYSNYQNRSGKWRAQIAESLYRVKTKYRPKPHHIGLVRGVSDLIGRGKSSSIGLSVYDFMAEWLGVSDG